MVANDDADTEIVRAALRESIEHDVEVRVEDTDVVCLLIHHGYAAGKNLYLTTSEGSYDVKDLRTSMPEQELKVLLWSHSFTGCDTVSAIHGLGKVSTLKKMSNTKAPSRALEILTRVRVTKNEIVDAGLELFQFLYGNPGTPLDQQRYEKYNTLTAKKAFKPEKLPPTRDAATQHILRAYLQFHDWMMLQSQSMDPTVYGWRRESKFEPIGMLNAIAPEALLKLIFCNCRFTDEVQSCSTGRCTCRKHGMKCIPACGNCHGLNCSNTSVNEDNEDNES